MPFRMYLTENNAPTMIEMLQIKYVEVYLCLFFRFAGIQEIVLAYQNCIRQVQLYGPTNVAPIINHVIRFAERAGQENTASVRNRYHIGHDRYFVGAQQYTDGC